MKLKAFGVVLVTMALVLILNVDARPPQQENGAEKSSAVTRPRVVTNQTLKLVGAILVPGNPIRFDISWVDSARGRYYLAESGNAAVDVFDAENDLYFGRISGF